MSTSTERQVLAFRSLTNHTETIIDLVASSVDVFGILGSSDTASIGPSSWFPFRCVFPDLRVDLRDSGTGEEVVAFGDLVAGVFGWGGETSWNVDGCDDFALLDSSALCYGDA